LTRKIADIRRNYGSAAGLDYNVHLWKSPAFVFFSNPKVACSTTKASLNLAVAAASGQTHAITSMHEVHDRAHNLLLSPGQIGDDLFSGMLDDPRVIKFAFVRDPVSRLCAAYLTKLVPRSNPDIGWVNDIRNKLFDLLRLDHDSTLSFEAFARLCAESETVRELDPHWRLQRREISFDQVPYSFIGNQARWAGDFALVSGRIFGAPVEVFDVRKIFRRSSTARELAASLSGRTRRRIEQAYAADFAMLEEIDSRGLGNEAHLPAAS